MQRPERFNERGLVVIECPVGIPCNPCVTSCPFNAVSKERITAMPEVDYTRCTGCTLCVSRCPGLAMFVVAEKEDKAFVTIPYEFIPLPERGEEVDALDREGRVLGRARVVRVMTRGRDRTAAITLEVPKEWAMEVRNLR